MIAEVHKDDMVFGVFPFMSPSGLTRRWFETTRELLDGLEQTFDFLHDILIAHRDFSFAEVFLNFGSAQACVPDKSFFPPRPRSFRKFFDAQYFINDFELSVQYSPSSDPASRRVVGHPSARYGDDIEIYGKALAPEARLDEPYCPFKADVYQLGQEILLTFGRVTTLPGLVPLAERMASTDPSLRPSIAEALVTLCGIRLSTSDTLLDEMPRDAHGEYGWDEQTDGFDSAGPTTLEATFSPDTAVVVGLAPEDLLPNVKKFGLGTDAPLSVLSANPQT
ncbi:hypothetical protein EXIGLDRAFT_771940 [Exidia glandulosa HHB12029]|uniref:Protein kinase domain-containing protein n=1 Tax=Exidia glandulosa HHB12029 TaxID=1314781 RepID=A0A165FME2_EXIGL|nr:hypothetical protein EXIGLDRAFT_771940 [Exidia glandulosa HHB12029]